jgi:hypothetical protein
MQNTIKLYITIIFGLFAGQVFSQTPSEKIYQDAFTELHDMISGKKEINFKRAVFITENAYFDNSMSYTEFCKTIDNYEYLCHKLMESRDLLYPGNDKEKMSAHAAVFTLMTDTIPIQIDTGKIAYHLPFVYDFEDISGKKEWSQMFVSKLLTTHSGNCHSLPYLYKIIAEELEETAHLAFAPNHTYIKIQSKEYGWFNTELTSGMFPIDSWLMASGYVHLNSIQNGIYMDTLSQKQSIAACMVDLAQGFEKKNGIGDGKFIISVCDTALKYYPNFVNALLVKAETRFQILDKAENMTKEQFETEKADLEKLYMKIHNLGYRQMPGQMYLEWLVSLKTESAKYQNTKLLKHK